MAELKDFAPSVAIVVSSCDPFFDSWKPFAFFSRKFWPTCPFATFLVTNQLRVRSTALQAISVGPDLRWGWKLIAALRQIPHPYVIYMQEDYFLRAPVDEQQVADDLAFALREAADSFSFRARSRIEPNFQRLNDRFGIVPVDSDGRTRAQITLWKKDALLSILREEESVWDFEAEGSSRTRSMKVFSYSTRELAPIKYVMSAIVRGLWTTEALALCGEHGFRISPDVRGIYTEQRWLQRWRRLISRRRIARELARLGDGVIDLDSTDP